MRFLSGCLVFLAVAAATPQDSFELRSRYGEPVAERFNIRPGVTMTVGYGTDGKACVLEIEPRKDYIQTLDMVADANLSVDTVTSILDEVVPPSARGKETMPLFSAIVSGSCNSGMTFGEYEKVRIDLSYGFCAKPIGVHSTTVFIKRRECHRWGKSLFPTVHK